MSISNEIHDPVRLEIAFLRAVDALDAKAAAIGAGPRVGDVTAVAGVDGAFVSHHDGLDVYVAADGVAHEVHGDIRVKYDALGGPAGRLGLPVTDETGTPDGRGRFNHFVHGSIHWAPHTGPMAVLGRVRDRWAAAGWERGPLGYPVRDQHTAVVAGAEVPMEWCLFENGVVAADGTHPHAVAAPVSLQDADEVHTVQVRPAKLTYAELGQVFGARFNRQFQASPDNVALRAGVELTGVGGWTYDLWAPRPRTVGFRLHGFHDNGLATDTDFRIDLEVALELVWTAGFTEPRHKTLVARLTFLRVVFEGGLPLGPVIDGVRSAVHDAFQVVDPGRPEIPLGSTFIADVPVYADDRAVVPDVLGVVVDPEGSLQVLVNPLPPPGSPEGGTTSWAALRQFLVQDALQRGARRVSDGDDPARA